MFQASNIVAKIAARAGLAGLSFLSLLCVGTAHAQVYIADGSLESLAAGHAPNVGTPNGAWQFPQGYVTAGLAETVATEFTVSSDVVGGFGGKTLFLRNNFGTNWTGNCHLAGLFETAYVRSPDRRTSIFTFDAFFPGGTASGGAIYLGTGFDTGLRGPQLSFIADGPVGAPMGIHSTNQSGQLTFLGSVPRNQWTTFEITSDVYDREFDLRLGERGTPLEPFSSNLGFRGGVGGFDRVGLAMFSGQSASGAYQGYFDNFDFEVIPAPGSIALLALASIATTRRRRA